MRDFTPSEHRSMPLTRWSLVARAADVDDERRVEALDELLEIYRSVLRNYLVRGMRVPPSRADDLVQKFLAERVLGKNVLGDADRSKGRFRSFLLKSFKNYVISCGREASALKRAPDAEGYVSLGEYPDLIVAEAEVERALDLAWALQTVAAAVDRVRETCKGKNRPDMWDVFEGRLLGPILYGKQAVPYQTIAERYGFRAPDQLANVLLSVKRMFRRVLREIVRDTVADESAVDEEIEALKRILYEASSQLCRDPKKKR